MSYDIVIRGGLVIDGSGQPGEIADVAVHEGRIAALGRSLPAASARTVDADGLAVAPGLPGKRQLIQEYLSASAPWLPFRETTFGEYLDSFPRTSVNAGMLVGHHTLRLNVMGMEARPPSRAELDQMTALLEEGLAAGALGLSSGLFTPPSSYADRAEMVALCNVLKRWNAAQILAMIEAARQEGLAVDCDAYPYRAGSNPLKNLLPQWVQSGGLEAMLARLAVAETRERVRVEIERDGLNNWGRIPSWDSVQISISPHLPQHAGETFGKLAAARGHDPIDVVCD